MARHLKYSPDRVDRLLQAIRLGSTYKLACQFAGISDETFARWQRQHMDFVERLKEAEGSAVVGWLAKIEKAANDGNWQAAAWKLERRYPHEYGRQIQEITGRDGQPLSFTLRIEHADDTEDELPAPTPLALPERKVVMP